MEAGAKNEGLSYEQLLARLQECYDDEIDAKILNVYVSGSRYCASH